MFRGWRCSPRDPRLFLQRREVLAVVREFGPQVVHVTGS